LNSAAQVSTILYVGSSLASFLSSLTLSALRPVSLAMASSDKPSRLAFLRTAAWGSLLPLRAVSISKMFWTFCTKNSSHFVISAIRRTLMPRRKASAMTNNLWSVAVCSSLIIASSDQLPGSRYSWSISRDRMAFNSPSSMVLPMAITSPVLFIWVPRVRSTVRNLSKGQRGIFRTT